MHSEIIWFAVGVLSLVLVASLLYIFIKNITRTKSGRVCSLAVNGNNSLSCDNLYSETRYDITAKESNIARKGNSPFIKGVETIDTVKDGAKIINSFKNIFLDEGGEYNNEFSDC